MPLLFGESKNAKVYTQTSAYGISTTLSEESIRKDDHRIYAIIFHDFKAA